MSVAIVGAVGIIGAAGLALLGVWLSDRTAMKKLVADANDKLVDNLQEERSAIKADVAVLKRQVGGLLLQGRYKDDYINMLRDHIEKKKGPPPPGYPTELLHIAMEGL